MTVGFNPLVSNNRIQKQNFCAINQKWAEKLTKSPEDLSDFDDMVAFGDVSSQDAVDTLKSVKDKIGKGFQDAYQRSIDWAKDYKAPKK